MSPEAIQAALANLVKSGEAQQRKRYAKKAAETPPESMELSDDDVKALEEELQREV